MSNSALKKIRSGTEVDRFMSSFSAIPFSGCWIWMRALDADGYGVHYYMGKKIFAHRRSYQLHVGDIDAGLMVCHTCDTPSCVNPSHLFLGTCKENIHDAIAKDRFHRGERHGRAKLGADDVALIRSSDLNGQQLAQLLGVNRSSVNRIRRGEGWL
jgi:hypothetical protein